jgi:hypothetical protein
MIVFRFLSVYDADMTVSRLNNYIKMIFKFDLDQKCATTHYNCVMQYTAMSYCVKCFEPADVCFCEIKKVPLDEYTHEMKECVNLKCYCKKHIPKMDA